MQRYRYKARAHDGEQKTGFIDAHSQTEAAAQLMDKGWVPSDITPYAPPRPGKNVPLWRKKIKNTDHLVFLHTMHSLTRSGMPAIDALQNTIDDIQQTDFRKVLHQVHHTIVQGARFSEALAMHPDFFSPFMVAIVEAAENRGELEHAFLSLYDDFLLHQQNKKSIIAALIYPLVTIFFALVVAFAVAIFLAPMVLEMLKKSKVDVPRSTQLLIDMTHAVMHHYLIIAAVVVGIVVLLLMALRHPDTRLHIDRGLMRLPIFGPMIAARSLYQLCQYSHLLLLQALPMDQVLLLTARASGNAWIAHQVQQIARQLQQGVRLTKAFVKVGGFPHVMVQLLKAGETTDTLTAVFADLSQHYLREFKQKNQQFKEWLQPLLIILVLAILIVVILGMYMPILEISSALIRPEYKGF